MFINKTNININKIYFTALLILISAFFFTGCMKYALRSSSGLFNNISISIFKECDPEFAKKSLPANLKLLEGLLESDPENSEILKLLSMGFCGYSLLFIENNDPERASSFYLRALQYGLRGLKFKGDPGDLDKDAVISLFNKYSRKNADLFLWTVISWNLWIYNNLDAPSALAQIGPAELSIDKMLESDPEIFYGLPYILKATSLSARSPMYGGDYEKAKIFFEKSLNLSGGDFYLAKYFYAKHYCVGTQNRKLFTLLLNDIIEGKSETLPAICLINRGVREMAISLLDQADDFFF